MMSFTFLTILFGVFLNIHANDQNVEPPKIEIVQDSSNPNCQQIINDSRLMELQAQINHLTQQFNATITQVQDDLNNKYQTFQTSLQEINIKQETNIKQDTNIKQEIQSSINDLNTKIQKMEQKQKDIESKINSLKTNDDSNLQILKNQFQKFQVETQTNNAGKESTYEILHRRLIELEYELSLVKTQTIDGYYRTFRGGIVNTTSYSIQFIISKSNQIKEKILNVDWMLIRNHLKEVVQEVAAFSTNVLIPAIKKQIEQNYQSIIKGCHDWLNWLHALGPYQQAKAIITPYFKEYKVPPQYRAWLLDAGAGIIILILLTITWYLFLGFCALICPREKPSQQR